MSHVSKEVAEKFEKLGYPQQKFYFHGDQPPMEPLDHPDMLAAADWLFENHSMEIIFGIYGTKVFSHINGECLASFGDQLFSDHRNRALLFACEQIEKQTTTNKP